MIVVVVLVVGGGFSLLVWIFCATIDFEWVCLDLEKNMKNEVHVLGLRFEVSGFDIFLG